MEGATQEALGERGQLRGERSGGESAGVRESASAQESDFLEEIDLESIAKKIFGNVSKDSKSRFRKHLDMYVEFVTIPATKFAMRWFSEVVLLALNIVVIFRFKEGIRNVDSLEDFDQYLSFEEGIWIVYSMGMAIDDCHKHLRRSRIARGMPTNSGTLAGIKTGYYLLFVVSICLRLFVNLIRNMAVDIQRQLYTIYQVVHSINMIFLCLGALEYLAIYEPLGVIIIMLVEMLKDVATWLLLFMMVTMAFMFTLSGLALAGYIDQDGEADSWPEKTKLQIMLTTLDTALLVPLYGLFGEIRTDTYNHLIAVLVVCLYMFIGAILLVNLLVAMFAETYTRVREQSITEYTFTRCQRLYMYRYVHMAIPPVINAPLIVYEFLKLLWLKVSCCFSDQIKASWDWRGRHAGESGTDIEPSLDSAFYEEQQGYNKQDYFAGGAHALVSAFVEQQMILDRLNPSLVEAAHHNELLQMNRKRETDVYMLAAKVESMEQTITALREDLRQSSRSSAPSPDGDK